MCQRVRVRATDDDGVELNARYDVVPDGDHLALVLHSAGGGVPPRNHEYVPALRLLLGRLRDLHAVLVGAFVDSDKVQHLPEAERSLISAPVELAERSDIEQLRLELTSAQGGIGQPEGATKKGNNSKKIRLRLDVPGFHPSDARHLEVDLAGKAADSLQATLDRGVRRDLLVSLAKLGSDEPVALLWAIGHLAAGHERVFGWAEFSEGVGPLLVDFGRTTPEVAYGALLARPDLWEGTEAHGGFTPRAADRLGNRRFRAQVIDVLRRDRVVADFDRLLAEVGLADYDAPQPTALDVLRPLVGRPLTTVDGSPNRILRIEGDTVLVATGRSPEGTPVPIGFVQDGLDLLRENGVLGINPKELNHRSAFVGAVLKTLPGAEASTRPAMITMTATVTRPKAEDPTFAVLDGKTEGKYRKEQRALRRILVGDLERAECALCGHEFPIGMLVAAHVKDRAKCTDEERNDLRNVAVLACAVGCDHLFGNGYLSVDASGLVVVEPDEAERDGRLGDHLRSVRGRKCGSHRPESAAYFAWHHENRFCR